MRVSSVSPAHSMPVSVGTVSPPLPLDIRLNEVFMLLLKCTKILGHQGDDGVDTEWGLSACGEMPL